MTSISTLGQALDQIERIKEQQAQFSILSTQLTSGKKGTSFSALQSDVIISKRSRADLTSVDSYINNIDNVDRRIKLMLSAIDKFRNQAKSFYNALTDFSQQSVHQQGDVLEYDDPITPYDDRTQVGMTSDQTDGDFKVLQNFAGNLIDFLKDLMNTKDGDRYLMGGAEVGEKPLNDTGLLNSSINVLISSWKSGTIDNAGLIADLTDRTATGGNADAITDTIVGYSAALSAGNAGKAFIRVDDGAELDYTALANETPFRNILVAAHYISNESLPPIADAYIEPNTYPGVPDANGAPGDTLDDMKDNFFAVFNEITAMVNNAVKQADDISFRLNNVQARLDDIRKSHVDERNLLTSIISNVEDVDINEAAVKLTTLQVQLDASFRITAKMQQFSLANFLQF